MDEEAKPVQAVSLALVDQWRSVSLLSGYKLDGTQEQGRTELDIERHTTLSSPKPVMITLKWKMASLDTSLIP